MKKITISNNQALNMYQILNIIGANNEGDITAKFNISKNIIKLKQELEAYETERMAIINHYALKDEQGNILTIENSDQVDFGNQKAEALNKLGSLGEVMFDTELIQLKLSQLNGFNINALQLVILDPIIIE